MRKLVARASIAAVLCGAISVGSDAGALSISAKPSKPFIAFISAKARIGKVDITVKVQWATANLKPPVLATEVKVGSLTCIASSRAATCTVKGVSAIRTVKVSARARNKNGFGPWSTTVLFKTIPGSVWRRNASAPGSAETTTTVPGGSITSSLKFDLKSAVGLALKSSVSSTGVRSAAVGSNLQTIDSSGGIKDALVSGSAKISRFLIAPNDKIYVVFSNSLCMLAEIDRLTGIPTCIEADQNFQFVPAGQAKNKFGFGGFRNLINDFQFDSSGAIYYLGTPGTGNSYPPSRCCASYFGSTPSLGAVVRKYLNGKITDFGNSYFEPGVAKEIGFTDNMTGYLMLRRGIYNFLVLPDGKVLIDQEVGIFRSLSDVICPFSRLDIWNPDGTHQAVRGLLTVKDHGVEDCKAVFSGSSISGDEEARFGQALSFLQSFGSSDVVVGREGQLFRIDPLTATAIEISFSRSTWCQGEIPIYLLDLSNYFCNDGTTWRGTWKTPSGEFYAIVGQDPAPGFTIPSLVRAGSQYGAGVLARIWPTLADTPLGFENPQVKLTRVESFLPILDSVVASGTTPDGGVQTVLYNTQTKSTEVLIPTSANLHPLKFSFNAGANKILFSAAGLMGVIDLTTKHLTTVSMNGQFEDVQAFAS